LNDEVTVISLKTFTVADHYTKSDADTLLAAKATVANFTSTGIDDNATSTAITIDASEDIEAGTYNSSGATNGIKFNLSSNTGRINISSINSTSDMLNFNTTNGEVGSIQAVDSGTIYSTGGAGGGIKLGGTGAANTLDDYEEGTWTPVITPEGRSACGISTQENTYTKIGRLVVLQFSVTITSISGQSNSRAIELSGLPFNMSSGNCGGTNIGYSTLTGMSGSLWAQGNTTAYFRIVNGDGGSGLNASDHLQVNSVLKGTIPYFTT
jgi:hypothetical protein